MATEVNQLDCHVADAPRNDIKPTHPNLPFSREGTNNKTLSRISKFTLFTKPSRGTSEARVEQESTGTLSSRCDCVRCRFMRGAVARKSHRVAFTLAEVLITLGIIAVVAVMTLPSVIADHREKQTVVRLKQTYNQISQAVNMMILGNGELDQWEDESIEYFEKELTKHLNVIGEQTCPYALDRINSCSRFSANHKYVLKNGVVVGVSRRLSVVSPDENNWHVCSASVQDALSGKGIHYGSCAYIDVDLNGRSKPNKNGKDTFEFRVYKNGVLPRGHIEHYSNDGFDQCFNDGNVDNNTTCTAWVIYHENMDYLKCRDKLSYDKGPYSCKN